MIDNIEDLAIRRSIIETDGNIVVLASAGTGKTHTIIDKILHISTLDTPSFKKIAAITFTEKAADELKERLYEKKAGSPVVAKTIHAWVLNEILQPFLKNVCDFNFEGKIKFGFGTKKPKIKSFAEGLEYLGNHGEILSYGAKPKNNIREDSTTPYATDGKDFTFQLAMKVLKDSQSASDYIKATYRWIFVDEYQDVNLDQNILIQYLIDELHIKAVVVGDEKQDIYSFRGSNSKYLTNFFGKDNFNKFILSHNFRSNAGIVSYSRLFDTIYQGKNEFSLQDCSDVNLVPTEDENMQFAKIASEIIKDRPNDSIMIVRKTNNDISSLKSSSNLFNDFQTSVPLDYAESEYMKLFSTLIKIRFGREHLFSLTQFIPANIFHEKFSELKSNLESAIAANNYTKDLDFYSYTVGLSEIEIPEMDWKSFKSSLTDVKQRDKVLEGHQQYSILTVHSSKGLEADHVIYSTNDAFQEGKFQENNHYVAITRAKRKLWLLDTNEMYRNILKNYIEEFEQG